MTNQTEFLATLDLDAHHATTELDDMIRLFEPMIPNSIDHFTDDCHDDPEAYITSSPTFNALNSFTPNIDDFYARFNAADFIITHRMIAESIAAELRIALAETASAHIILNNYLTH